MQIAFLFLLIGIIIGILLIRAVSPGFKKDIIELEQFMKYIKGEENE